MQHSVAEAVVGHNNPPPYIAAFQEIDDLYEEAEQWLDGEKIETQQQADSIAKLQDAIRAALKKAEALRVEEKTPFDDAIKEIQERYNPYTHKDKGKAALAIDACKKAVLPYLRKIEQERLEREEKARLEAEEARQAALKAMQESQADNLQGRADAEAKLAEAKKLEKEAAKISKTKSHAKGGGRAMAMRSVWKHEIVNGQELARHIWVNDRQAMDSFLDEYARKQVFAGIRKLPGVEIKEEKVL